MAFRFVKKQQNEYIHNKNTNCIVLYNNNLNFIIYKYYLYKYLSRFPLFHPKIND